MVDYDGEIPALDENDMPLGLDKWFAELLHARHFVYKHYTALFTLCHYAHWIGISHF